MTSYPGADLATFLAADRAARLQADAQRRRLLRGLTPTQRRSSLRAP
jgi:hypothetical protein